ncbi:MAG: hypothetical protein KDA83_07540 [Planctomycetales bacterium]|nr:hypothetical protein [Planctomycetales bacterium]
MFQFMFPRDPVGSPFQPRAGVHSRRRSNGHTRPLVHTTSFVLGLTLLLSVGSSLHAFDDWIEQPAKWVEDVLDDYTPCLGGSVETAGTVAYDEGMAARVGLTDEQRTQLLRFVENKLSDHTLFTRSLQEDRRRGRTDDHVRTRRQSYNADAYERVERIVGEDTTRTLKQVTLQLHLKKYLIGDPGLRRAVGISNRELNVIGPALCEGDRLSTSLAPGIQLVPLEQQIANGIRLMEPSDQARLRLLLGQPMCGIYQRVCDELGWGATAGLNGSGDGSAGN